MHPTFAPAINFQGGKYGVGLLSRQFPLNVKNIPLPGEGEERVLLVAEFSKYYVCCTHFALSEEDRKQSVTIIADTFKGITKPVFLAGDMNSLYQSPEQELMRQHFITLNNPKQNTFPSNNPSECIDYIYGLKNAGNTYSVLARNVLTNCIGSDHLPLYVDVHLKADVNDIFRTKPTCKTQPAMVYGQLRVES